MYQNGACVNTDDPGAVKLVSAQFLRQKDQWWECGMKGATLIKL